MGVFPLGMEAEWWRHVVVCHERPLQALALLANLLMKDYVKWRGALFHRFALALVDGSPAVRRLAEHLLGDTLATKVSWRVLHHAATGETWVGVCCSWLATKVSCRVQCRAVLRAQVTG